MDRNGASSLELPLGVSAVILINLRVHETIQMNHQSLRGEETAMAKNSEPRNVTDLLSKMCKVHSEASDLLNKDINRAPDVRMELARLNTAIATLASLFAGRVENTPTSPEALETRRLELTKVRANHLYEYSRLSEKAVIDFSLLGLRGLMLANGGALIATLTLIGSNQSAPASVGALWVSVSLFVVGLFFALLTTLLTYIGQGLVSRGSQVGADKIFFAELGNQRDLVAKNELVEQTINDRSRVLRRITVASSIVSGLAFAAGSIAGILVLT